MKNRKTIYVLASLLLVVIIWTDCTNSPQQEESSVTAPVFSATTYNDYAPEGSCAACHAKTVQSHLTTAHYLTGQPAYKKYILGSFQKGRNEYWYSAQIRLAMEERDSSFYQVAYFKGEEKKAMRFDIVIGSGVLGQSYLTWRGDRLYQLPITFFTAANQWSNSPGFPSGKVMIDRPVSSRCLECHISYAQPISGDDPLEPYHFEKNSRHIQQYGL